MMSQSRSGSSHESQTTSLRRRLGWRRTILEVLGIALVVAAFMVNWPPSDDPSLPATRPFLVLVGVLVFAAGLALERRSRSG
jgi:drug/metabolite transporter (DMT)-like permease